MNKTLLLILLACLSVNAQNKELIKNTFHEQTINNIDQLATKNGYAPKTRITMKASFKCDDKGKIFNIQVYSENNIFKNEIKGFITQIPQLDPEEYINKGDEMKYELKLQFKLPSKKRRKKISQTSEKLKINYTYLIIKEHFPFKRIEVTEIENTNKHQIKVSPTTEQCKDIKNYDQATLCLASELKTFVTTNLDTDLLRNLRKGTYRVMILFYISKDGEIVNVRARAPHPKLAHEAERVINAFPHIVKGGTIDGQPADIAFGFPIVFVKN